MWRVLLALLIVALWAWNGHNARSAVVPAEARALVGEAPVIVLSAAWCGYCRRLKSDLKKAGVPFREFDIESTAAGERAYDLVGARGIPVTFVGSIAIHGYDPERVIDLAHAAGVPELR